MMFDHEHAGRSFHSHCSVTSSARARQVLFASQGFLLGRRQIVRENLAMQRVGCPAATMPAAAAMAVYPGRMAAGGREALTQLLPRPRRTASPAADRTSRCCGRTACATTDRCALCNFACCLSFFPQGLEQLRDELLQEGRLVRQLVGIDVQRGVRAHYLIYARKRQKVSPSRKDFFRNPADRSTGRSHVAPLPLHARRIDAPQQQRQLLGGDRHAHAAPPPPPESCRVPRSNRL